MSILEIQDWSYWLFPNPMFGSRTEPQTFIQCSDPSPGWCREDHQVEVGMLVPSYWPPSAQMALVFLSDMRWGGLGVRGHLA